MPNTEDPIQTAIESCADDLAQTLGADMSAFVSVHFLCGLPESPGYIRRSAGRAMRCALADYAAEYTDNDPDKLRYLHRRALLEHVRAFDRRHTLFNLAARISRERNADVLLGIRESRQETDHPFLVKLDSASGKAAFTILVSRETADFLAPKDESLRYLNETYRRAARPLEYDEHSSEGYRARFERARAEVFGRLLARTKANEFLDSSIDVNEGGCGEEKLWNLLNPIQSTLVYAQGMGEQRDPLAIHCQLKKHVEGQDMEPLELQSRPLILVFSSQLDTETVETITAKHVGSGTINTTIANYLQRRNSSHPIALQNELASRGRYGSGGVEPLVKAFEREVAPIVCLPTQRERLTTLTWWMCLLAQKLFGRDHEGEPLDFWFVAGERSEFADDVRFHLDKLLPNGGDRDALQVPLGNDGKVDGAKLEAAIRYLEKEHFPWFHRGRHALLFDISDERFRPVGLVEVANSSWRQVLDESYKQPSEQHLHLPGCAVVFVDGETRDAGVIRCDPRSGGPNPRIRRLMRMQKGQWQVIGSDLREQQLRERIKTAMDGDAATANDVTEICLRVADDLTIGGTVVITKDRDCADGFLKLGESWTFGEALQDRIPLIAHDGATIVFPELKDKQRRWHWRYRRILTPGKIKPAVQDRLQRWSLDYLQGTPLNGVGTRRWSAALTALREGVRLVVVISQDGGVTCWWLTRHGNKPQKLHYLNLPLGDTPRSGECEFSVE